MSKITFRSRKEVTEFLKEKGIDTSNWTEEKWQSINTSQAEIHIQALAEAMWDARNESTPKELKEGEFHLPFGDKLEKGKLTHQVLDEYRNTTKGAEKLLTEAALKISTARCARLSYMTFNNEIDYEKDIQLHDRLLADGHMSPAEHCARVMSEKEYFTYHKGMIEGELDSVMEVGSFFRISEGSKFLEDKRNGWCNNFKGFIPYRYLIENNN